MISKDEIRIASQEISAGIGMMLGQEYKQHDDGFWWLYSLGKPQRPLTEEEVEWHTVRKHQPFVEGGLVMGDPHWWDDPDE